MTTQALHPNLTQLLKDLQQRGVPPVQEQTPVEAREIRNPILAGFGGPKTELADVEDRIIPGPGGSLPARVYTPTGSGPFPILVYFHGGGWVVGNLDTHDSACRLFADRGSCIVLSVDYRLSPENKFPSAIEDGYAAVKWANQNGPSINGDPTLIAVGGDSAGGNMAAVVCMMARDRGGPEIKYQILIYPVTDLTRTDTESYQKHGEGYMLTREGMVYFIRHYVSGEADKRQPYASPLLADNLSDLPPALVIAAEFDVLTDEGLAYAERLKKAGVPVTYRLYTDMFHAYINLGSVVDCTRETIEDACARLATVFNS